MGHLTTCVSCKAEIELPSIRHQPHCMTEECVLGFARHYSMTHVEKQGDCEVWLGSVAHNGDVKTPMVRVTVAPGKRRDFRVLAMRDDPKRAKGRVYENMCGTPRCVNLAHHRLVVQQHHTDRRVLQGKLPIQPLMDMVEQTKVVMTEANRKRYNIAVNRGWITVGHADEICIDELGTNPAFIYGEAFFDA